MRFEDVFAVTVGLEGDFANDRNDPGGKTRFGITEAVARANGYAGDMKVLPYSMAITIAKRQYWDVLRLDEVAMILSGKIAAEVFDTSYNMGVGVAGKFVQRALNIFNRGGQDYPDVTVDGVVGPMTVQAMRAFIGKRGAEGEAVLLRALNAQQGVRYIEIAEANRSLEDFEFGWFSKRVS